MRKTKIESGVYRIGEYVAFREDSPSVGDRYDRWGNVTGYEVPQGSVTWGVVTAETYERDPRIGLPEALFETRTLADAQQRIEAM